MAFSLQSGNPLSPESPRFDEWDGPIHPNVSFFAWLPA
jgi:hypothetical protein